MRMYRWLVGNLRLWSVEEPVVAQCEAEHIEAGTILSMDICPYFK
jgi:hypothetical protein